IDRGGTGVRVNKRRQGITHIHVNAVGRNIRLARRVHRHRGGDVVANHHKVRSSVERVLDLLGEWTNAALDQRNRAREEPGRKRNKARINRVFTRRATFRGRVLTREMLDWLVGKWGAVRRCAALYHRDILSERRRKFLSRM